MHLPIETENENVCNTLSNRINHVMLHIFAMKSAIWLMASRCDVLWKKKFLDFTMIWWFGLFGCIATFVIEMSIIEPNEYGDILRKWKRKSAPTFPIHISIVILYLFHFLFVWSAIAKNFQVLRCIEEKENKNAR